jgi:hypothetical protein
MLMPVPVEKVVAAEGERAIRTRNAGRSIGQIWNWRPARMPVGKLHTHTSDQSAAVSEARPLFVLAVCSHGFVSLGWPRRPLIGQDGPSISMDSDNGRATSRSIERAAAALGLKASDND